METLDQVTNRHPRGDGVGIYDDIRSYAFTGEWHVLLSILNTTSTLLTMSASKFVSNLWNPNRAYLISHKNGLETKMQLIYNMVYMNKGNSPLFYKIYILPG